MTAEESTALRLSRLFWLASFVVAATVAVAAPIPGSETLRVWLDVARDIAGVVVTIAAIWLGMLFGEALERARRGSGEGGSELVRQLMRPLRAGGMTLAGALLWALVSPYLERAAFPGLWNGVIVRGRVFVVLLLSAGALFGLLLALAPVKHILGLLKSREAEADAHPPTPDREFVESGAREPWHR